MNKKTDVNVYKAINAVQADIAKLGIAKDREAKGYKFRGIDDVYNALSPLLAQHGLCILPRVLSRTYCERTSASGNVLSFVTVETEFDFVCVEDGSKHTVKTFGEAMDVSDKATSKAMSAAYKYAAFQAFAIPTEGDNDADAASHELGISQVVVDGMRDAAMRGTEALKRAHANNRKTPGFEVWWMANADSLKNAAQEADEAPA